MYQTVVIPHSPKAKQMAALSDGAIVGSAIIKIIEKYGKNAPDHVGAYVRSIKEALRSIT